MVRSAFRPLCIAMCAATRGGHVHGARGQLGVAGEASGPGNETKPKGSAFPYASKAQRSTLQLVQALHAPQPNLCRVPGRIPTDVTAGVHSNVEGKSSQGVGLENKVLDSRPLLSARTRSERALCSGPIIAPKVSRILEERSQRHRRAERKRRRARKFLQVASSPPVLPRFRTLQR